MPMSPRHVRLRSSFSQIPSSHSHSSVSLPHLPPAGPGPYSDAFVVGTSLSSDAQYLSIRSYINPKRLSTNQIVTWDRARRAVPRIYRFLLEYLYLRPAPFFLNRLLLARSLCPRKRKRKVLRSMSLTLSSSTEKADSMFSIEAPLRRRWLGHHTSKIRRAVTTIQMITGKAHV